MLHEFITLHRSAIIERCRAKLTARLIPVPTESEINHGVPLFLDQLVGVLQHLGGLDPQGERPSPQMAASAGLHGQDLLKRGFTVGQVVHDYGDVCQSITEIAIETNTPITSDEFRTLNRCLDDAIADAVTAYGSDSNRAALVIEGARETERLGFFVHEARNLLQTATIAFEVLEKGKAGMGGSTAAVLRRSLLGLAKLVERSVTDIRLTNGLQHPEVFSVGKFIDELALTAALRAAERQVTLTVLADQEAALLGDRQNLGAAVTNLLQNAIKFTRVGSTVTLRAIGSVNRILIEIQDECGGLAEGASAELFHPFEQRNSDRTGLGLGLAYSQWAVIANGGRIYVRNLPGAGCVFVVDLPRHSRRTPELPATSPGQTARTEASPGVYGQVDA